MSASALARMFSVRWLKTASLPAAAASSRAAGRVGQPHLRPYFASIAICAFVFGSVFVLWRTGRLQFFELQMYDIYLRSHASTSDGVSPIVVVGITEADLQRLNVYPFPDAALHEALRHLVEAEPAAVVVDLYRNLPIPGEDPAVRNRLASLFAEHPNIIAIQRLGLANEQPIASPPFLAGLPGQIGFNDFAVLDQKVDDTVRRVALMMEEFDDVYYSDPLLATILYLQAHDIEFGQDPARPQDLRLGKTTLRRFQPNDGAYVNADARGYQILLNFRGPAKFRTFEFTEAMSGKIPPETLRGKVVFIGPLAPSLKDFINTPLATRFPGLLLHAHIVNQLVEGAVIGEPQIRFWGEWEEALWILIWCIAGTLAGTNTRSLFVSGSVLLACAGILLAAFWFAMLAHVWLLIVAPAIGLACTAALSTAHQAYLEKSERNVLMSLFAQHVSANIAADIWERRDEFMDGHRPRPQVIQATVFFTDLKGFTSYAEAMPPEALIDWLNEYMEVMSALIEKHGGMVNKYMGDAIMAAFGAPIPRTTREEICRDATNAADCALAMAQELDRLNEDWKMRGLPTTAMRVGIASGRVVSGSIGGHRRYEYTVTGDTVVIAKRLESAEKDSTSLEKASRSCRILISEDTFNMIGPAFEARKIGPMRLEGKIQPVGVYVLSGMKKQP